MSKQQDDIRLHSAGAIVRHNSPFHDLPVPANQDELSKETREKWVIPFYMTALDSLEFLDRYKAVRHEINPNLVKHLLGDFNWRPRIVAAKLAAIENYHELEEMIGNLFLRSDVCDAGRGYCIALACFNTSDSMRFLRQYLDYYLTQKDLWFDQNVAMAAVAYLDRVNGTNALHSFMQSWEEFIANKPNWDLQRSIEMFSNSILAIERIREAVMGNSDPGML
jgi:hypothetical protein